MSTRTVLALTAILAAAAPATSLAEFHVAAPGVPRVVISTKANTGTCHLHRNDAGSAVRCEDGSRGTMTFYAEPLGTAACELDFWWQPGSGNSKRWHAVLSHQDPTGTGCTLQWQGSDSVIVTIQQQ